MSAKILKLLIFLLFAAIAGVIMVRTWIRNRISKGKEEKLIAQLKSRQIHLPDFVKDYQFRLNTLKEPAPDERKVEQLFSSLENIGNFEIRHFEKLKKGEFLFVTRSFIEDYVITGTKSTKDIRHYDTYVFIVKLSEENIIVCSDVPVSNESRGVRADFCRQILARLKTL